MLGEAFVLLLLSAPGLETPRGLENSQMSPFDQLGADPVSGARAERALDRLTRSVLQDILEPAPSSRTLRSRRAAFPSKTLSSDSLPGDSGQQITDEVRAEVADRWGVAPDRVGLEWGLVSEPLPERVADVRILGTGSGGHWVVVLRTPEGQTRNLRVRAGVRSSFVVAARSLQRGHVLREEDMARSVELEWGPPVQREAAPSVGWEVRRRIREGERLNAPAVTRPDLVRSGEGLEVVWRRGPIAISLRGDALGSGALGDTVMVRTEHGRRLTGTVLGRGVVMVGATRRDRR